VIADTNTGKRYVKSYEDSPCGPVYLSPWGPGNIITSIVIVLTGTIYVDVACAEWFITLL
jgi:hypothetical protein